MASRIMVTTFGGGFNSTAENGLARHKIHRPILSLKTRLFSWMNICLSILRAQPHVLSASAQAESLDCPFWQSEPLPGPKDFPGISNQFLLVYGPWSKSCQLRADS